MNLSMPMFHELSESKIDELYREAAERRLAAKTHLKRFKGAEKLLNAIGSVLIRIGQSMMNERHEEGTAEPASTSTKRLEVLICKNPQKTVRIQIESP